MLALAGFHIQEKRTILLFDECLAAIGLAAAQISQRIAAVHNHFFAATQDQPATLASLNPTAFGDPHPLFDFHPLLIVSGVTRRLCNL